MKFEDLSDKDAQGCAWAFGLHSWKNREELNRQWHEQGEIIRKFWDEHEAQKEEAQKER